MRIDAYNQISQMYQSKQVKPVKAVKKTTTTDAFEISQAGRDYQTATQAVKEAADVIVQSNDADGVAKFIETRILEK